MPRSDSTRLDETVLAEMCLSELAESPENLAEFMGVAGYDPASLRAAVGTKEFGRGLLDYFASNEPLLLTLCANRGLTPEAFMRVWHQLNPSH